MTPADVEAIARRVVELLREEDLAGPDMVLLSAAEVAPRFGVTSEWVRDNADRLGAIRLGDGPRPRLRFDPKKVAAALNARSGGVASLDGEFRSESGPAARRSPSSPDVAPGQSPRRSVEVSALPNKTPRRGGSRPGPTPGDTPDANP